MTTPAARMAEAEAAAAQVREAADVLGRIRDINVTVQLQWQQFGDLPDADAETLRADLAAVAARWAATRPSLTGDVAHRVKTDCTQPAHAGDMHLWIPALWKRDDPVVGSS